MYSIAEYRFQWILFVVLLCVACCLLLPSMQLIKLFNFSLKFLTASLVRDAKYVSVCTRLISRLTNQKKKKKKK